MSAQRFILGMFLWTLAAMSCTKSAERAAPTPAPAAATGLIGGVVAFQPPDPNAPQIALHDVEVELRRDNAVAAKTRTDAFGGYTFENVAAGTYTVCAAPPGWERGCATESYTVGGDALAALPIELRPDTKAGRYIHGTVTLADGRAAAYADPLFDVASYATVSAPNGAPVRVNHAGKFVLTAIRPDVKSVVARVDQASAELPVPPSATVPVEIRIPNRAPVTPILAAAPRARSYAFGDVYAARPGESIAIQAGALDDEQLTYRWRAGGGEIAAAAGAVAQWKAPPQPGRYLVDVLIGDRRGGFDRKSVSVLVRADDAPLTEEQARRGASCSSVTPFFACPDTAPIGCPNTDWLSARSNSKEEAELYYANVDSKNQRLTFDAWKHVAGFDAENLKEARASYTNDNDLGFGRDMHITENANGVFAYVTNFLNGCRLQDPENAKLATEAKPENAIATVCMEYSSATYDGDAGAGGTDRIVKFFVYDGQGKRLTEAILDPTGAQPIPGICLSCHGGLRYTESDPKKIDLKARFLPFDIDTFQFHPANNTQLAQFRELNRLVAATFPPTPEGKPDPPIVELIKGWYAAGNDQPNTAFAPGDWDASDARREVYRTVVARSCRTCHAAFDTNGRPTWARWDDFQKRRGRVRSTVQNGNMPHAFITYTNFWSKDFWKDGRGPVVWNCFTQNTDEGAMAACLQSQ